MRPPSVALSAATGSRNPPPHRAPTPRPPRAPLRLGAGWAGGCANPRGPSPVAAASATETPVPAAASSLPVPAALMSPEAQEFRAKLKELRDYIKTNADNVGEKFPEEARKMHYGETEHRPIYGEASPDDARALIEEGVEVLPIPALPDDRN